MSAISKIEWTERTWNPVRGCSIVSPGCVNCYAMKQAHRFSGAGKAYEGLTKQTKAGPQWTGQIRTVESALLEPLSWRKPARVFVNSMSDIFHEDVPDEFIDRVFAVMACAPQHTFQILTKRPERLRAWATQGFEFQRIHEAAKALLGFHHPRRRAVNAADWPLPNVWLGVSCEDQQRADERIPLLLQTPAAVRFVSAEPLLGPIALRQSWRDYLEGWDVEAEHASSCHGDCQECPVARQVQTERVDWVIVGGESGPGARPCNVEWIRAIVRQCQVAGVAVFTKQLGAVLTGLNLDGPPYSSPPRREGFLIHWTSDEANTFGLCHSKGGDPSDWPEDMRVREFPRSAVPA